MKFKKAMKIIEVFILIAGFVGTLVYYHSSYSLDLRDTWVNFKEGEKFKITIKDFELQYYLLNNNADYEIIPCIILDDVNYRAFNSDDANYKYLVIAKGARIENYSLTFEIKERINEDVVKVHIKELNTNIDFWLASTYCAEVAFCAPYLGIGFIFVSRTDSNNNFTLMQYHELFPSATVREALKARCKNSANIGNYFFIWYQEEKDTFYAEPKSGYAGMINLTNKTYHLLSHKNRFDRIVINYYHQTYFTIIARLNENYNFTAVESILSGPYHVYLELLWNYNL